MDKRLSYGGLWLKSRNRYHRQLFLWILGVTCLNNSRILFEELWPRSAELIQQREKNGVGWTTYFQIQLGETLVSEGEIQQ
jgi:hypothetical protein